MARSHPAAATRRLVAGLSTAATLGIVAALGISGARTDAATASPPPVVETPPSTIVQVVYRYVEVPAAGGTPAARRSGSTGSTGGTSTAAVPAPAPAAAAQPAPQQPVTQTKGS